MMKFDLLLWVINVLYLKLEQTALSSELGVLPPTGIGATIFLPLRTQQVTTLHFLAVQVSESSFSPQFQNPKHHLLIHWNCCEPFSMSPWKDLQIYLLGPTTFSLHTLAPACTWGMTFQRLDCSSSCWLSGSKFPFNSLTSERNTH